MSLSLGDGVGRRLAFSPQLAGRANDLAPPFVHEHVPRAGDKFSSTRDPVVVPWQPGREGTPFSGGFPAFGPVRPFWPVFRRSIKPKPGTSEGKAQGISTGPFTQIVWSPKRVPGAAAAGAAQPLGGGGQGAAAAGEPWLLFTPAKPCWYAVCVCLCVCVRASQIDLVYLWYSPDQRRQNLDAFRLHLAPCSSGRRDASMCETWGSLQTIGIMFLSLERSHPKRVGFPSKKASPKMVGSRKPVPKRLQLVLMWDFRKLLLLGFLLCLDILLHELSFTPLQAGL